MRCGLCQLPSHSYFRLWPKGKAADFDSASMKVRFLRAEQGEPRCSAGVAHLAWDQRVAGSIPATSTILE